MTVTILKNAIHKGLEFLVGRQLPTGQFPIEVTFHYKEDGPTEQDQSIFATTHLVYSLGFLPQPDAQAMTLRALTYFQSEMSGHGLWRFWNKAAQWGAHNLFSFIPADLDDMASVSLLLQRHGIDFPDNRSLMLLNRNRVGLFYTWLVLRPILTWNPLYWRTLLAECTIPRYTIFWKTTEAGYNDIDGVINANILLYLGERPETRPIIDWLTEIVRNRQEATCGKWYRDPYVFYHALSRNHPTRIEALGTVREPILARLAAAARENGQIGEQSLHTALAAISLLNFDEYSTILAAAIIYLLKSQNEAGYWQSKAYYYGGPKQLTNWGSAELTTDPCQEI
jgi:hypothetical protein